VLCPSWKGRKSALSTRDEEKIDIMDRKMKKKRGQKGNPWKRRWTPCSFLIAGKEGRSAGGRKSVSVRGAMGTRGSLGTDAVRL